ncbi:hypothetical protein AYO45_06245, partial [Gammaproteobacteria bacterium SCGC AG-212-F23]
MWKRLSAKLKIFIFLLLSVCSVSVFALDNVEQLLQERIIEAKKVLLDLQHQQEKRFASILSGGVNQSYLNQADLDIAVAKANLENINVELSESQQTINRLQKNISDIINQMNLTNIFGGKISHAHLASNAMLQEKLDSRRNLLESEKTREKMLQQLRNISSVILQIDRVKFLHVQAALKSRTMMQLKEQQMRSEMTYQQQQSYWIERLSVLHKNLTTAASKSARDAIDNDIFFANENMNFSYLQMLIARYEDQMQQLNVSTAEGSSVALLNKIGDQMQLLSKQLERVNGLLKSRIRNVLQRKALISANTTQLDSLITQYQNSMTAVQDLQQQLLSFHVLLDKALQRELSTRQNLPGLNAKAWIDLGQEILFVPTLGLQMIKSLSNTLIKNMHEADLSWWSLMCALQVLWLGAVVLLNRLLAKIVSGLKDHESGHINLKWVVIKLLRRCMVDVAFIGCVIGLFYLCNIPEENFIVLMNLGWVWLFFKAIITSARVCLMETMHDNAGHDVRLYHRLKWSFVLGGVITALTVFVHQLPAVFELKDLFDRMFLLFLLVVSVFLLKSWEVFPEVILTYIDERHTYLRRIVKMLGLFVPMILLANSAIGLIGYVNLVHTISWYEGIFLLVMVGYLVARELLNDGMEFFSRLLIQHVSHGWLWTEAVLKPFDKVLRLGLFLTAWMVLFFSYNLDQQPLVIQHVQTWVHHRLVDAFGIVITPVHVLQLCVVVSLIFWGGRWTREFSYRLLLARIKDLGLRDSLAILTQYFVILIGLLVAMKIVGIDFKMLTVVAGAFVFAVGLGLRDLANNFVCGFLLLLERPLRVGDTIEINGFEGDVVHIGSRAVTIRTIDHMEVMVPNAEIFSKTFLNWTAKDTIVRSIISLHVDHHDQPLFVQKLILETLASIKEVLTDPEPEALLKEMNEGDMEFEVRYHINVRHVKSRISMRSQVMLALWHAFEKHGIKMPAKLHEIRVQQSGLPFISENKRVGV